MTAISPAQRLAALPADQRAELLQGLDAGALTALSHCWRLWARPDQLPPPGDWRTWLILAGRGWGKTKTISEWISAEVEAGRRRQIGVIGPTADSVRRVMVEGPSGILAVSDPSFRPDYESSTRRIIWPNGVTAHLFSAEEPDRLRGPNFDCAVCDELAAWANAQDAWDNLQLALRIPGSKGDAPRCVISTTPRPVALLKDILAAPGTVTTRGRTIDNAANLDAATLRFLENRYGGTTLGRQELDGELIEDADGALWSRSMIEAGRVRRAPELNRIVVAIDPAGSSGRDGAETGIVVAGIAADEHIYIVEDASGRFSPDGWARRAVEAYQTHKADRIVAESNFGGAMVEATLRSVARNVPVTMARASRGKSVRAEPVVALYEQRKVHHVGHLMALEEQLVSWVPNSGMPSPDRLDALVWAVTELSLNDGGGACTVQRLRY
jgi:phage terminase large subunit-like protein